MPSPPDPTAEQQLFQAFKDSGWTLMELLKRSGLEMTPVSLGRKLRGEQVMTTGECDALGVALDKKVIIGRRRKAA